MKATLHDDWEQAFVLRVKSGFEIPMAADQRPNPEVWKFVSRPARGVNDYYKVAVDGRVDRYFSQSTMTWYELSKPPYIPQIIDAAPQKEKPAQAKVSKEPVQINEDFTTTRREGFSDLATFFQ